MGKEEIKDYLKRVDELWTKLTGEYEETLQWLIYGYNQCAKLLNETKQQCKNQKEVIDKAIECINKYESIKAYYEYIDEDGYDEYNYDKDFKKELLDILKEVKTC